MTTTTNAAPVSKKAPLQLGIKRVLVPTDFSDPSGRALAYAWAFAKQFQSELLVVHIYERVIASPRHSTAEDLEEMTAVIHENLESRMREFTESVLKESANHKEVNIRYCVRYGSVVQAASQLAKEEDVDLLVISTHGRTGLSHVIIGSNAEKIVRYAPCPILVVREHEHEFIELPA